MNIKATLIALVVLVVVLLLFIWLVPPSDLGPQDDGTPITESVAVLNNPLVVDHFFAEGVHTIEGTLQTPTPCYIVASDARVAESAPEQVTIAITATATGDVCAQVLASKIFSVTFSASEGAVLSATINGVSVDLDVRESGDVRGEAIEKL